jgi:hypothetical protein
MDACTPCTPHLEALANHANSFQVCQGQPHGCPFRDLPLELPHEISYLLLEIFGDGLQLDSFNKAASTKGPRFARLFSARRSPKTPSRDGNTSPTGASGQTPLPQPMMSLDDMLVYQMVSSCLHWLLFEALLCTILLSKTGLFHISTDASKHGG